MGPLLSPTKCNPHEPTCRVISRAFRWAYAPNSVIMKEANSGPFPSCRKLAGSVARRREGESRSRIGVRKGGCRQEGLESRRCERPREGAEGGESPGVGVRGLSRSLLSSHYARRGESCTRAAGGGGGHGGGDRGEVGVHCRLPTSPSSLRESISLWRSRTRTPTPRRGKERPLAVILGLHFPTRPTLARLPAKGRAGQRHSGGLDVSHPSKRPTFFVLSLAIGNCIKRISPPPFPGREKDPAKLCSSDSPSSTLFSLHFSNWLYVCIEEEGGDGDGDGRGEEPPLLIAPALSV